MQPLRLVKNQEAQDPWKVKVKIRMSQQEAAHWAAYAAQMVGYFPERLAFQDILHWLQAVQEHPRKATLTRARAEEYHHQTILAYCLLRLTGDRPDLVEDAKSLTDRMVESLMWKGGGKRGKAQV